MTCRKIYSLGVFIAAFSTVSNAMAAGEGVPATEAFVRSAYQQLKSNAADKQDKPQAAALGNLAKFDMNKNTIDAGVAVAPSTTAFDGTSDAKIPTSKAVAEVITAAVSAADSGVVHTAPGAAETMAGTYNMTGTMAITGTMTVPEQTLP